MTSVSASFLLELNFPCHTIGLDKISETWSVYFCVKYLCAFVTVVSMKSFFPVDINHVKYCINIIDINSNYVTITNYFFI